jgi:uncharacterized membrane protein
LSVLSKIFMLEKDILLTWGITWTLPIYASLLIIIFLLLTLLSLSYTEQSTAKTQYFQNLMPNN